METDLRSNFRLADLFCGLLISCCVASAIPGIPPKARAIAFITSVVFVSLTMFWSCALLKSFEIQNFWLRFLIHIYALVSIVEFFDLLVQTVLLLIAMSDWQIMSGMERAKSVLRFAIPATFAVAMTIVERRRIRAEKFRLSRFPPT